MTETKWVLSPQHWSPYIRSVKSAVIHASVGHFAELQYLLLQLVVPYCLTVRKKPASGFR